MPCPSGCAAARSFSPQLTSSRRFRSSRAGSLESLPRCSARPSSCVDGQKMTDWHFLSPWSFNHKFSFPFCGKYSPFNCDRTCHGRAFLSAPHCIEFAFLFGSIQISPIDIFVGAGIMGLQPGRSLAHTLSACCSLWDGFLTATFGTKCPATAPGSFTGWPRAMGTAPFLETLFSRETLLSFRRAPLRAPCQEGTYV